MAVSSNQKVGELARIAYLALLHAEGELGEETNTFDGDKWSDKLRGIRSADDPDERLAKIIGSSSTSSSMDLRPKEE